MPSAQDRDMLECVYVQGFIQDFEFWERGTPKFSVNMEGVGGGGLGYAPINRLNNNNNKLK